MDPTFLIQASTEEAEVVTDAHEGWGTYAKKVNPERRRVGSKGKEGEPVGEEKLFENDEETIE